jgi:hypothetical protein
MSHRMLKHLKRNKKISESEIRSALNDSTNSWNLPRLLKSDIIASWVLTATSVTNNCQWVHLVSQWFVPCNKKNSHTNLTNRRCNKYLNCFQLGHIFKIFLLLDYLAFSKSKNYLKNLLFFSIKITILLAQHRRSGLSWNWQERKERRNEIKRQENLRVEIMIIKR